MLLCETEVQLSKKISIEKVETAYEGTFVVLYADEDNKYSSEKNNKLMHIGKKDILREYEFKSSSIEFVMLNPEEILVASPLEMTLIVVNLKKQR